MRMSQAEVWYQNLPTVNEKRLAHPPLEEFPSEVKQDEVRYHLMYADFSLLFFYTVTRASHRCIAHSRARVSTAGG
jgi:hypothetical protein